MGMIRAWLQKWEVRVKFGSRGCRRPALGHEHLKDKKKYIHDWGIGRHILGSQIFDYWQDPWGHGMEHWTDGDLLDGSHKTEKHPMSVILGSQWGPAAPPPPE